MSNGIVLGGAHRGRGIVGGRRDPVEWAGYGLTLVLTAACLIGAAANLWLVLVAVLVLLVGLGVWTPFEYFLDGRSVGALVIGLIGHRVRRARGQTVFTPAYITHPPAADPDITEIPKPRGFSGLVRRSEPAVDVPQAVGPITPLNLDFSDGTSLCLVRHTSRRSVFITATMEMLSGVGGVSDDEDYWRPHLGWSRFVESLAGQGSLITSLQQVARVVPADTRDHTEWMIGMRPVRPMTLLDHSYAQLLTMAPQQSEQHRTWLTITMPMSMAWGLRAQEYGTGDLADLLLATDQLRTVERRAAAAGIGLRTLSEPQLAGVIRGLQDPDVPLDRPLEGGLKEAFLPWDDSDPRRLVVEGSMRSWMTRSAQVRGTGLSGERVAPDFLRPLLTNVEGSVIRTISSSINLIPAPRARRTAKSHAARDGAGLREEASKTVSDGSAESQHNASMARVHDLRPGTGAHGANWTLAVSYSAPSREELTQAGDLIGSAAENSHITRLAYADRHQQRGAVSVLPLGLGIKKERRL